MSSASRRAERRSRRGTWRRFIRVYRSVKIPWALLAVSLIVGIVAAQVQIWLAPFTAQIARGDLALETLLPGLIGLTCGTIALSLIRNLSDLYAQERVTRNVRSRVWHRLLHAPLSAIDEQNGSELVSRVTNDPRQSGQPLFALAAAGPSLWGLVGATVAMAQANSTLTQLYLTIIPLTVVLFWLVGVTQFYAQRLIMQAWGTMTGFFTERLGMIRALRAASSDQHELAEGTRAIDRMFRAGVVQVLLQTLQTLTGSVISNASLLIVFVGGAYFVRQGEMPQEDLSLFYALAGTAMPFLFELLTQYQLVKGAQGFMDKIGHVIELPREDTAPGPESPRADADLRLQSVSFGYHDREVLHDVTVTIPAGKHTTVIGTNGSGKSTLIKLLQRQYEPSSGSILLGDTPASRISLGDWRRSTALVPQNPSLLSGTVRENIAFGDEDMDASGVETAARDAGAWEFISQHSRGLDLEVGEEGEKLSSGQRQRVALARALATDPQRLLLDEAGSALDGRARHAIDDVVQERMTGRMVVSVSHRVCEAHRADNIIVMREGTVVAAGPHEELVRHCAHYRDLLAADQPAGAGRVTGTRSESSPEGSSPR